MLDGNLIDLPIGMTREDLELELVEHGIDPDNFVNSAIVLEHKKPLRMDVHDAYLSLFNGFELEPSCIYNAFGQAIKERLNDGHPIDANRILDTVRETYGSTSRSFSMEEEREIYKNIHYLCSMVLEPCVQDFNIPDVEHSYCVNVDVTYQYGIKGYFIRNVWR